MSANTIPADRLVHVIVEQGGRRTFFHHTDRLQDDKSKRWFTVPVVDDDPAGSHPVRFDIALVCKQRWRDELGLTVRLALEQSGPYIDQAPGMNMLSWEHRNYLVSVDRDGKPFDSFDAPCVYKVIATLTPSGKMFCLRFNHAIQKPGFRSRLHRLGLVEAGLPHDFYPVCFESLNRACDIVRAVSFIRTQR